MPRGGTADRRYAEAAFELATAEGQPPDVADGWRDELDLAAELLGDEHVAQALANPSLPWSERDAVLSKLLGERISAQPLNLVRLLARRGRADLIGAVATEYRRLLAESRGIAIATVTSAQALSDDDAASIRSRLEQMTGRSVDLQSRIDPALIGGVTVRVGDRLIDASVRGRLERLRNRLTAGSV